MAKKNHNHNTPAQTDHSLDMSKGFSTNAFSSLKSLQEIRKAEAEDKKIEEAQKALERRDAQKAAQKAAKRQIELENTTGRGAYMRFTEEDLQDASNLSDEEIFAASMAAMDHADLYQEKFNKKEDPIQKRQAQEEHPLTMTEEEKEFAIFTQEMAITQVRRLDSESSKKKKKNRIVFEPVPKTLTPTIDASPADTQSGMKTNYITPTVTVTQSIKGEDVLHTPQPDASDDPLTPSQHKCLKEINRYQERFGAVITLKLRGLVLNAAIHRLNDFLDSCERSKTQYGLIICGKGIGSKDEPVIKNTTVETLKSDDRIAEYIPVLNEDHDFGSIYVVFKTASRKP